MLREKIALAKLNKITSEVNNYDEKTIQMERMKEQETLESVLFNGDTSRMYREYQPTSLGGSLSRRGSGSDSFCKLQLISRAILLTNFFMCRTIHK